MRDFATDGRAASLSLPARLLYTVFAVLTLAGCLSCVVIYDGMVKFGARTTPAELKERLVAHYAVPDDSARQKLVETTHAHLFSMPVLLLVAGHLFLLCGASLRIKVAAIAIASGATVLHLLAPWLIVLSGGNALAAAIYPLSGGLLLICFTLLLALPVWQMWTKQR